MKILQIAIFVLCVFMKAFGQQSLTNLPDSLGVYSNAEQMPEYKGGELELYSFIRSILVYPQMEMDSGIQGRVFVRFIVDENGQARQPVVIKGVSAGIDREAVNAVLKLKDFIPAREKGKKVKAYLTVPITFQIKYVQGSSDDKASLKSDVLTFADQMPEFPGGDAALIKFLQSNIVYPQIERDNDIQGKVLIRFVVAEDGTVSDVSVVRGVSPGLDREAQRVVKMLPAFKPAMQQGKPVKVYYNLPVVFKLARSNKASTSRAVDYVDVMPYFPGGGAALIKFLQNNIMYPEWERNNDIEGKIYVRFIVNKEGIVDSVRLLSGVSDGLNSEALRVVKMLPNFKPALRNGKPVNVYINLPVSFRLERSKNEITLGQKLSRDKNFKSAYTNYAFEKYEDAIKYFKKSIIEFPFDYMSYELKGECEMALGNTYMACKDFRLALQNGSPTAAKLLDKNCK